MVDAHSERQRFVELLPFYVNGTLDAKDHDWVDAYLATHPNAENELKFMQILRESTRNTTSKVPEAQRLERLLGESTHTVAAAKGGELVAGRGADSCARSGGG